MNRTQIKERKGDKKQRSSWEKCLFSEGASHFLPALLQRSLARPSRAQRCCATVAPSSWKTVFIVSEGIRQHAAASCHRRLFEVQSLFIFLQGFFPPFRLLHWRILKQNVPLRLLCEINIKCHVPRSHRNCAAPGPLSFSKTLLVEINWTWNMITTISSFFSAQML